MQFIVPLYLILINAAGLLIMCLDKRFAVKNRWRIPESTLLLIALLGGSLGSLCGMHLFRHKTKKMTFRILLPLFLTLHIVLAALIYWL